MKTIEVHKTGESHGFCAEYYEDHDRHKYVKVTHPSKKTVEWFTALPYSWEPDIPLAGKPIKFVEIPHW
jgi:hypothetical protein